MRPATALLFPAPAAFRGAVSSRPEQQQIVAGGDAAPAATMTPPPEALAPCPGTRTCQRCCWRQHQLSPPPLGLPWPPPIHRGLFWSVAAVWWGCCPAAELPPNLAGGAFGTSPGAQFRCHRGSCPARANVNGAVGGADGGVGGKGSLEINTRKIQENLLHHRA